MNAIIVGAGVAGLATAIRLAKKGIAVSIFERSAYHGGKLTHFKRGGYRFDLGPSLFTLPNEVDELLNNDPNFAYHKLLTTCHYFYPDGTFFRAFANKEKRDKELTDTFGPTSDILFNSYLQKAHNDYNTTSPVFLEQSLHQLKNYFKRSTIKGMGKLPFLPIFGNLNEYNKKHLKNEKLVQLFNRYATYNGSDPYQAPAMLSVIPHLEFNQGAFLPEKGMRQISDSLYEKAKSLGVKFHFSQGIDKIIVENNTAKGVVTQSEKSFFADHIISNVDVFFTYKNLLKKNLPKKIAASERSSSALIFYWGIKKTFKQLDVHNILFSDNYQEEFKHIFGSKTLYTDPTVYINITSKMVKTDAPENAENWFVMINTPHITKKQDWEVLKNEARRYIINKINATLKIDVAPLIEEEHCMTPEGIQNKTGSYLGSLYGMSSNSKTAAFMRHSNFHSTIKGLYFVGGSVHPGGGIPLCLMSAKIVSEIIN